MPSVAVIGASSNRSKFGNKAVRAYADQGYTVYPVNPNSAEIEGHKAYASILDIPAEQIDRVTVYLPPSVGLSVVEEVAKKKVGDFWLNPGSESPELVARAKSLGLKVVSACSIVAIGVSPAQYP